MNVAEYYNPETGFSNDPSFCDWCVEQAIQALIDDNKEDTAKLFLGCRISWRIVSNYSFGNVSSCVIHANITTIHELSPRLTPPDDCGQQFLVPSPQLSQFHTILRLILGPIGNFGSLSDYAFQVEAQSLPANWREELLEIARKKGTTNQGRQFDSDARSLIYANLRFRSEPEIRIAKALDKAGVMYYANCTARVNSGGDRVNREPDFLICHNGRWGIIEVDGKAFHPALRKAQEDGRDRLFKHHGVSCIEHYPAEQCLQEPAEVVASFLALLAMNG